MAGMAFREVARLPEPAIRAGEVCRAIGFDQEPAEIADEVPSILNDGGSESFFSGA